MPSSRAVFDLNNRKSGVNRHLWFCQFPKNSEVCSVDCVLFTKPWHHTLHISELKYATIHAHTAHFRVFLEIDKTAGACTLQIYDYLSQVQRETKAFLIIVRDNTEGPPIPDWQWRHRKRFFFIELKNSSSNWRILLRIEEFFFELKNSSSNWRILLRIEEFFIELKNRVNLVLLKHTKEKKTIGIRSKQTAGYCCSSAYCSIWACCLSLLLFGIAAAVRTAASGSAVYRCCFLVLL